MAVIQSTKSDASPRPSPAGRRPFAERDRQQRRAPRARTRPSATQPRRTKRGKSVAAALDEALDGEDRGRGDSPTPAAAAPRRRAASRSARTSSATVPPFIRKMNTEPPTTATAIAAANDVSASGRARSSAEDRGGQIADVEAEQRARLGADDERHEHDAADERHRDDQLEQRVGRRLDEDDGPVRRGHQPAALQRAPRGAETASRHHIVTRRTPASAHSPPAYQPLCLQCATQCADPFPWRAVARLRPGVSSAPARVYVAGLLVGNRMLGGDDDAMRRRIVAEVQRSFAALTAELEREARAFADAGRGAGRPQRRPAGHARALRPPRAGRRRRRRRGLAERLLRRAVSRWPGPAGPRSCRRIAPRTASRGSSSRARSACASSTSYPSSRAPRASASSRPSGSSTCRGGAAPSASLQGAPEGYHLDTSPGAGVAGAAVRADRRRGSRRRSTSWRRPVSAC